MLTDILRPEGSNPGGNCSLQFAPDNHLYSMPVYTDGLVTTDFVFRPGKRLFKIEVIENKLGYNEECTEDTNGSPIKVTINGLIRGDGATLRKLLAEMTRYKRYVIKMRDNAGITRVIGADDQVLNFSYKFSTGDQMSDLRSYTFQFYGTFNRPVAVMP